MILNDVKTLLGLNDIEDAELKAKIEERLTVIQTMTENHYKTFTGAIEIPKAHDFIITEVIIKRYNRIGSEGFSEHVKEGLTVKFGKEDFNEYMTILNKAYPESFGGYGGIKFL